MADLKGRMFERRGDHLVPADLAALEFVQSLEEGRRVLIDHRKPRHPENHAHFFAILNVAVENMDGYPDTESLLDALKLAVGHTRPVVVPIAPEAEAEELAGRIEDYLASGAAPNSATIIFHDMLRLLRSDSRVVQVPKSISFDAMPEDEFQRFKKRCLYVLENFLGQDPQALLEEVGRRNKRNWR